MATIPGFRFDITGASGSQGLLSPKESWKAYVFPRGAYASQASTGQTITFDTTSIASRFTVNDWVQVSTSTANIRQVMAVGGNSITVNSAVTVALNDRVFVIGQTQPTVNGGSATYTPDTYVRQRDDTTATLYTNSMITTDNNGLVRAHSVQGLYDMLVQDGNQSNQGYVADFEIGHGDFPVRFADYFARGSSTSGIQEAINDLNGVSGIVYLNAGVYTHSVPITAPDDGSVITIVGAGKNLTVVKATASMTTQITKGSSSAYPFNLRDLTLNADRLASNCLALQRGKGGILVNLRCFRFTAAGILLGVQGGTTSSWLYETRASDIDCDGDNTVAAASEPDYGIRFFNGATDNHFRDIVMSYMKTAGLFFDGGTNNLISQAHIYNVNGMSYGANVTSGANRFSACYFDGIQIDGVRIANDSCAVYNSYFYWPTGISSSRAIRVTTGVTNSAIVGNQWRGFDTASNQITFDDDTGVGTSVSMPNFKNNVIGNGPLNQGSSTTTQWQMLEGGLELIRNQNNTKLLLTSDAGNRSELWFYSKAVAGHTRSPRWQFGKNNTAESGSNVGSDFIIESYDDTGTLIGTKFAIIRATHQTQIRSNLCLFNSPDTVLTQAASLTATNGSFFGISGSLTAGTSIAGITPFQTGRMVILWASKGTMGFSKSDTLVISGASFNVPVGGFVQAFCTGTTWFVMSPSS